MRAKDSFVERCETWWGGIISGNVLRITRELRFVRGEIEALGKVYFSAGEDARK
jgi:hypothetical protein